MTVLTLLAIGVAVYTRYEGWWWFDSLYFCVVTLATVGFGDLSPVTTIGRAFTIGYIFAGIGVFLSLISILAEHTRERYLQQTGRYVDQLHAAVESDESSEH